jgi:hypothetical protein
MMDKINPNKEKMEASQEELWADMSTGQEKICNS